MSMDETTSYDINESPRRLALVKVNIDILIDIMTTGWNGNGLYCTRGTPKGARFIRADYVPVTFW